MNDLNPQHATPAEPVTAPEPEPLHVEPVAPAVSPEPAPETPEAPPAEAVKSSRTMQDIVTVPNEFTALEWLQICNHLDRASHEVQGDVVFAALAVAVVEDARDSALWRWEKYGAMTTPALLEHLGVDAKSIPGGDA